MSTKSKYKIELLNHFLFEMASWYGRTFKRGRIISKGNMPILLDLGVGANYSVGWINADFYRIPRFKFWKKYEKRSKLDIELDLRYPLPCDNELIDGVYSGHTLEHLTLPEAKIFLSEIFRVLKPGCWLRINVPDLEKYIGFYCGKIPNDEFKMYNSGCEAIHALTQEWGHKSCWDTYFLGVTLSAVGFINVNKVEYGRDGTDVRLIKEEKIREWETLVMEAQKPELL